MPETKSAEVCDIVIIIALKEEFEYFKAILGVQLIADNVDELIYYRCSLPASRGKTARIVVSFIGDMGNEESNLLAYRLIDATRPSLVISMGISGLINSDLKLGDVIVATDVDNYIHSSKIKQPDPSKALSMADDISWGGKSLPTTDRLVKLL